MSYAKDEQKEKPDAIKQWVNTTTFNDKFSPLHFASYGGNLKIIRLLLENGADPFFVNSFGLNMLHIAA